jgi:hypothetical protein
MKELKEIRINETNIQLKDNLVKGSILPEKIAEQPEPPPEPPAKQIPGTRTTQTTPTDHTNNNNNVAFPFDKELFTHLLNRVAEIYG